MRSASEFRQMARETLRGNWKLAMGTGLAASLIGAEIADTAPNGISELQKVIQARPEVKNVLTQVFLIPAFFYCQKHLLSEKARMD